MDSRTLSQRTSEHFEVARSLRGHEFTTAEFIAQYGKLFPNRTPGSILPSDYCVGRHIKGAETFPRFLERIRHGCYRFVGLHPPPVAASHSATVRPSTSNKASESQSNRLPVRAGVGRFLPSRTRPWHLDPAQAAACLKAYNSDKSALNDERSVFSAVHSGLQRYQVETQLRVLNAAYKTRASHKDLARIASAIDANWGTFSSVLSELEPLEQALPDESTVQSLLGLFLEQGTAKRPRSLATKALHFCAPQSLAIADTIACDHLAGELGTSFWQVTTGDLDATGMSRWWLDYMKALRSVSEDNPNTISDLLHLDEETSTLDGFRRVRGLPKILDKILWWAGKQDHPVVLFR